MALLLQASLVDTLTLMKSELVGQAALAAAMVHPTHVFKVCISQSYIPLPFFAVTCRLSPSDGDGSEGRSSPVFMPVVCVRF